MLRNWVLTRWSMAVVVATPMFAFAIDPAAVAAGLQPLREVALSPGTREVRVWTGFGLGIPHTFYLLQSSGGNVRGAIILSFGHENEWEPDDSTESMHAYVKRVFGCERIHSYQLIDACERKVGRRRPNWRTMLASMDSLGVSVLETPSGNPVVMDGFHMVVETRDAAGYRTAYFSMPSSVGPGDTPRAAAILDVLDPIREAVMRDSRSRRRWTFAAFGSADGEPNAPMMTLG